MYLAENECHFDNQLQCSPQNPVVYDKLYVGQYWSFMLKRAQSEAVSLAVKLQSYPHLWPQAVSSNWNKWLKWACSKGFLRNVLKSFITQEGIRVALLPLCIERSQFRHLTRLRPERLLGQMFLACHSRKRPPKQTQNALERFSFFFFLAWKCPDATCSPPEDMERERTGLLVRLLPPDSDKHHIYLVDSRAASRIPG